MATIQKTVKIPASRRLRLDLDLSSPGRSLSNDMRYKIILDFPTQDEIREKNKAAWEKLRELTKDSTLTVEKFLEMKNTDRALEAAIEERAQGSTR
jgi:hypothetical protein